MENRKAIVLLSTLMAAALAVVSFFGAFDASTYERDAASMAAQGAGQDLVDLVLVVPLLVISLVILPSLLPGPGKFALHVHPRHPWIEQDGSSRLVQQESTDSHSRRDYSRTNPAPMVALRKIG